LAAISSLRETLSELSLPSEDAINALCGPTLLGYAKALIAAVRELHDVVVGNRQ
jgi:hypothetical protein